jgi:hypothetical protein
MGRPAGRTKLHKISIWLDNEEREKVYKVVYKEKTIPSKIFRKALMDYVEKSLLEEDKESIVL